MALQQDPRLRKTYRGSAGCNSHESLITNYQLRVALVSLLPRALASHRASRASLRIILIPLRMLIPQGCQFP